MEKRVKGDNYHSIYTPMDMIMISVEAISMGLGGAPGAGLPGLGPYVLQRRLILKVSPTGRRISGVINLEDT